MPAPTTGRWRSVRAGAFTLLAAQITIAGHVLAAGSPPDLTLVVAISALLVVSLRSLGRQRRGFGVLLGAMAGTQVVFHLLLTLSDTRHPMGLPIGPTVPTDDHSVQMWVFHAAAAVLSAALLAYGETVLFALFGWLHRLLPRSVPPRPVAEPRSWIAMLDTDSRLRDRLVSAACYRRGPPLGPVPAS